jgi:hypothetical protein
MDYDFSYNIYLTITQEKYENTKWVIRSCHSKDKKYNRLTEKDKQWLKQHCSKTEDLESINRFKPATCLCLLQTMTWISMPYAAFYFGINEYVKKQNGYSNIFIHHCPLYIHESVRNDIHNFSCNAHVRIIIYQEIYHCKVYNSQ